MNSPPPASASIVDCEKRLLQLNAQLDERNKSLMMSPRISTGIPQSKMSRPLAASHGQQQAATSSTVNNNKKREIRAPEPNQIMKTAMVQEQYRNMHFAHQTDSDVLLKSMVDNAPPLIRPVMAAGDDSTNRSAKKIAPTIAAPKSKSHYKRNPLDELTRKNLSTEATIRFLKSKISILQQEHDSTRADQTSKGQIIAKQLEERKRLQASADKLTQQNVGLAEQVDKLEKSLQAARILLKTKNTELEESTRTIDEQKNELSKLALTNTNLERRLIKTAEDLEYTRQNVIGAREAEQEIARLHKADKRHAESQLKLLTDQRTGLIAAYKKQLYLLDNLKRQNVCLEQAKLIDFVERDFVRMLDYNKQ